MSKVMFLPQDYQAPKSSNHYMKFQDGENKFRILSQPVLGWEDWSLDKKPIRYRMDQKPAKSIDPKKPIKHFWAMIVWNYMAEEIQVLQITQASIRKALEALCSDDDWGAPYFYDIKVMKSGESLETEYTLNPLPHKPLSPHIQEMYQQRPCNLEALFVNADPFDKEHSVYTPGIFSNADIGAASAGDIGKISMEQAYELNMMLDECDKKYKEWFYGFIDKKYRTDCLYELPAEIYDKIKSSIQQNIEQTYAKQRQEPEHEVDLLAEGLSL